MNNGAWRDSASPFHAKRVPISRRAGSHFARQRGSTWSAGAVVGLMMLPLSKVKYDDAGRTVEIEVRWSDGVHRLEEHDVLNWIKHNRKLQNAGKMKAERVAMFKELLGKVEENRRVNQWGWLSLFSVFMSCKRGTVFVTLRRKMRIIIWSKICFNIISRIKIIL